MQLQGYSYGRRRRGMAVACRSAAALLAAAMVSSLPLDVAQAKDDGLLADDTVNIALGTFILDNQLKARVDGSTQVGTEVDFGKTFPNNNATRLRLDGFWRFADRHKLRFLWFDASNSGTRTIQQDIIWNGETYPIGASVTAKTKFSVYELGYEYAFLRRPTYEVSGTFGIHYTQFQSELAASFQSPGGGGTVNADNTAKVPLPLPVIGIRGLWNFSGNWWTEGSAQFFSANIDQYDGNLRDFRVTAFWQAPHGGFQAGVGFDYFGVGLNVNKDRFKGSMKWSYSGPQLFVGWTF